MMRKKTMMRKKKTKMKNLNNVLLWDVLAKEI
jgi:hypothetical protein